MLYDTSRRLVFLLSSILFCCQRAVERGAIAIREPFSESDEHGTVRKAIIQTYGDTIHTLIDRSQYKGDFLPGFRKPLLLDSLLPKLSVCFEFLLSPV
jgi:4-hydroxyphenylpyruvate dioxygenase